MHQLLFLFLLCVTLTSCEYFKRLNKEEAKDVIARVGEETLHASDLVTVTRGLHAEDSVKALKAYAETWVRKKLLVAKALENINVEELNIEGKVEDYRSSLLLFEYEKELVYHKLDTTVSTGELNAWYETNKDSYRFTSNAFLVFYIKLPQDAPDLKEARKWILNPKDEQDVIMLDGYCKQFAAGYEISKGLWLDEEAFGKKFPLNSQQASNMAGSDKYRELKTDEGILFMKIPEMFRAGEQAPLSFVSDKIRIALLEKRKMQLIENVYNKVAADALKSGSAAIFIQ